VSDGLSLLGKSLLAVGVGLAALGVLIWLLGKTGVRLLPGDIYIKRGSFTLFVPVVSCLALSVAATLLVWLVLRLRR
jgi:hypothetical protein